MRDQAQYWDDTPEEELKQDVNDVKKMMKFLLSESKVAHLEKTKGGCTPNCPKCIFYNDMGV